MQPNVNFSDRLQTSFAEVFGRRCPHCWALVILFAGYLLAKVLENSPSAGCVAFAWTSARARGDARAVGARERT
jgi:hypothetical protein